MSEHKAAKISEQEAKKELEKRTGIEFMYSGAYFDDDTETWCFDITIPNSETAKRFGSLDGVHKGSDSFIVSAPIDFEPYNTLAKHLKRSIFEVFDDNIWDTTNYGYDWKIGTKKSKKLYCWTGEGWLEIVEIESEFLKKFGESRKTLSMEDEKWSSVKIFRKSCYGTSYKKQNPEDEWATEYECELSFDDLNDKLIKPDYSLYENQTLQNKYIISFNFQESGPYYIQQIIKMIQDNQISTDYSVCLQNSSNWIPIRNIPEFNKAFNQRSDESRQAVKPDVETPVLEKVKEINPVSAVETVCVFCGMKLKKNAKFCPKCGLKVLTQKEKDVIVVTLPSHCPNCTSPIKATSKFCPKCGARVSFDSSDVTDTPKKHKDASI